MVNNKIITQIAACLLYFSCGTFRGENKAGSMEQKDTFYTTMKIDDLYRVPLVKPVQAISTTGTTDWIVKLPYHQIKGMSSVPVDAVSVSDSLIIIDAGIVSLPGENTRAWFFIDVKEQTETVCRNKEGYQKKLLEAGIVEPPLFHDINEVYRQFEREQTLPF